MKLLYKPFGIITGLVAARLGKTAFKSVWSRVDDRQPPRPTTEDAPFAKVVGAAVLEAAVMAGVGAAVNRAGAKTFHHLTGIWPGDKEPEPAED
jgi:hypothetical protein